MTQSFLPKDDRYVWVMSLHT